MHSQNFIHRDLKSLNIFMAKESLAKIGDLGCAIKVDDVGNQVESPTNKGSRSSGKEANKKNKD